jgi:hypothetical protein
MQPEFHWLCAANARLEKIGGFPQDRDPGNKTWVPAS